MTGEPACAIRKFRKDDRKDVRRICCATALKGKPSSLFFAGDEVLADALTLYFTDYEPESCFVAECNGVVTGYIIGSRDVSVAKRVARTSIMPWLIVKALVRGTLFKGKNIRFIWHCLISFFKREFDEPDFSKTYPATLHINIQEGWRDVGLGAKLIEAYLSYLIAQGVAGVHFATLSEQASKFFQNQHFELLYAGRRSYFRYILGRDIPIYIYGKRLS